ncbi:helix-turn-helix domain-containing protein [Streptomyces albus subsp. chlorinus]|uniref:ArsR/SmtB family transcription factor n=1 Tax=Streptomyces albus TaxID=1888 RepID=UPI00156F0310|nr:helix-turn-helix domain-containing protein [Streptomyces albus]NSC22401.1 helix-turn-helix domain-containing protein [Streptomyces albus subsp. chlorinus]
MSAAALARNFRVPPPPSGTRPPEPLPEPARDDMRLEAVMAALSDPLRLGIVRKLLLEAVDFDHTCTWFELDRPKSSLTHHFRTLREAGLIRQRQYGPSRRNQVRVEDLQARFPGLLDLVADWTPAA